MSTWCSYDWPNHVAPSGRAEGGCVWEDIFDAPNIFRCHHASRAAENPKRSIHEPIDGLSVLSMRSSLWHHWQSKQNCWLVLYLTFLKSTENVAVAWIISHLGAEIVRDSRIFQWDRNKDSKSMPNVGGFSVFHSWLWVITKTSPSSSLDLKWYLAVPCIKRKFQPLSWSRIWNPGRKLWVEEQEQFP